MGHHKHAKKDHGYNYDRDAHGKHPVLDEMDKIEKKMGIEAEDLDELLETDLDIIE